MTTIMNTGLVRTYMRKREIKGPGSLEEGMALAHASTVNGTVPSHHQRLSTPRLSCFTSEPGD